MKRPSAGASIRSSGIGSFMPRTSGAALMPQLPAITVVTPCEILKAMSGCDSSAWSSWVCESMKPGATMQAGGVDRALARVRRRGRRWRRCGRP